MKLLAPLLRKLGRTPQPTISALPIKQIVKGIPKEIKPVRGLDPKAVCKLILREGMNAEVVMQTNTQDNSFILEDRGEHWLVDSETRREVLLT